MSEKILEFSQEGYSKVLFSGSGISVDACLDRADGIRVHDEQQQALFLMLEQTGNVLFLFDIVEDSMYYLQVLPDGTRLERKISQFVDALHAARDSAEPRGQGFAQALLEARGRKTNGTVRYWGRVFTQNACWSQMSYRSLVDEKGKVYAVVGYNSILGGASEEPQGEGCRMAQLYEGDRLAQKVNGRLQSLHPGEKGVMFLLSIKNYVPDSNLEPRMASSCLRAIVEAIRSDFRGEDILGRVRENVFLVFICGETSIDIIERRAQRIIDLCQRVPMMEGQVPLCNVGAVASSSTRQIFEVMLKQAESALAVAKERGDNQYRLFEEEKY